MRVNSKRDEGSGTDVAFHPIAASNLRVLICHGRSPCLRGSLRNSNGLSLAESSSVAQTNSSATSNWKREIRCTLSYVSGGDPARVSPPEYRAADNLESAGAVVALARFFSNRLFLTSPMGIRSFWLRTCVGGANLLARISS